MQLSSRQRAAIVLRFHEDLSEEQTARVLGCAVGTGQVIGRAGPATHARGDEDGEPLRI
jgi:hypothetical protein